MSGDSPAPRRVLIVSPHWPPLAAPDLHRARMALPHLAENGWEPLVLALEVEAGTEAAEPELARTVPPGTRVWRARGLPRWATAWFGLRSQAWRSLLHLAALGGRVIAAERPQLVFLTTSLFPAMLLGRYWRWRFGIPYVTDFQDPWRLHFRKPDELPRGGQYRTAKYFLSRLLARWLEPVVLRRAAAVVAVSPRYLRDFSRAYPWLAATPSAVVPFGGAEHDLELMEAASGIDGLDRPAGMQRWLYLGSVIETMDLPLRALFLALCRATRAWPERFSSVRVLFAGAGPGSRLVMRLAAECGVAEQVVEHPGRVRYLRALRALRQADALLVLGSRDPGYTASKLAGVVLARRPVLAICHADSGVGGALEKAGGGALATYRDEGPEVLAQRVFERLAAGWPQAAGSAPSRVEAFTAKAMTAALCGVFDRVVGPAAR